MKSTKESDKRRWLLDTWPLKFLFGYGWCSPGHVSERKRLFCPDEYFDLDFGVPRHGKNELPEEICLLHDGNGTTYTSRHYSIRRILAARAWALARAWVYD